MSSNCWKCALEKILNLCFPNLTISCLKLFQISSISSQKMLNLQYKILLTSSAWSKANKLQVRLE